MKVLSRSIAETWRIFPSLGKAAVQPGVRYHQKPWFSATFSTWHASRYLFGIAADKVAKTKSGSKEHAMFKPFETSRTFSVIVCTILFSATCVLSAVGPAGAADHSPASVISLMA